MTLEEKLLSYQRTSPITEADQGIFTRMFLCEFDLERYANSWSYITQACRGLGELGYKYWDGEKLIGIGAHEGHFVLVNPLGHRLSNLGITVRNLCRYLNEASSKPVYVKHMQEKPEGFVSMGKYPWNPSEPFDDATFPEVVLDSESFFETIIHGKSGTGDRKLRLRLRRFMNGLQREADLHFAAQPLVDYFGFSRDSSLDELLHAWAQGDRTKMEPYFNMIHHPSNSGFSYVINLAGKAVGFFVFERIGLHTVGNYAAITGYRQRPGLTEACYYLTATGLAKFGITQINLGGSETESLHRHKTKIGRITLKDNKQDHLVWLG